MSCKATTKQGKPCRARPLKGTDTCIAHADKERRESAGFGGAQEGAGRPPKPKPAEIAQRLVEEHAAAVLRPYFAPLGLDLKDDLTVEQIDALTKVVIRGNGDEAFAEVEPDYDRQQQAAERLQDRVYGKPKQATEVTGAGGGPIEHATHDLGALDSEELDLWRRLVSKTSR